MDYFSVPVCTQTQTGIKGCASQDTIRNSCMRFLTPHLRFGTWLCPGDLRALFVVGHGV